MSRCKFSLNLTSKHIFRTLPATSPNCGRDVDERVRAVIEDVRRSRRVAGLSAGGFREAFVVSVVWLHLSLLSAS